jgi:hypothetical protein
VKRERSEIYAVIGKLGAAKKKRLRLGERRLAFIKLSDEIAETDKEIVSLSKRVTALMDGRGETVALESGTETAPR